MVAVPVGKRIYLSKPPPWSDKMFAMGSKRRGRPRSKVENLTDKEPLIVLSKSLIDEGHTESDFRTGKSRRKEHRELQ